MKTPSQGGTPIAFGIGIMGFTKNQFSLAVSIFLFVAAVPAHAASQVIFANQLGCDDHSLGDDARVSSTRSVIKLYDQKGHWTGLSWDFYSVGDRGDYACPELKKFLSSVPQGKVILNSKALEAAASTGDDSIAEIEMSLLDGMYMKPEPQKPQRSLAQKSYDQLNQLNREVASLAAEVTALREDECQHWSCAKSGSQSKRLKGRNGGYNKSSPQLKAGTGI